LASGINVYACSVARESQQLWIGEFEEGKGHLCEQLLLQSLIPLIEAPHRYTRVFK
jgi:hypothetical protein